MPASKFFAIIAGVGPGTGAAIAHRFSKAYPVVLMARSQSTLDDVASDISKSGGTALSVVADMSDPASVKKGFDIIGSKWGQQRCAAAVFNLSARPKPKGFLEMGLEEWEAGWAATGRGSFLFSQAVLPLLSECAKEKSSPNPPTLIFTGATASLKSSAKFSGFSVPKFALRALSQSLAKEFGPDGVHVVHAVMDGIINIPPPKEIDESMKSKMGTYDPENDDRIGPKEIAEAYWWVANQKRSAWTWELDLRPYSEKW